MLAEQLPPRYVRVGRGSRLRLYGLRLSRLMKAHGEEVEPGESAASIKLDVLRMIQADRLGFVRWFTLRVDGEIKGIARGIWLGFGE